MTDGVGVMCSDPGACPRVSAEVTSLLEHVNPLFPPLGTTITDAGEARRAYDALRTGVAPRIDLPVRDLDLGGVATRWYEPPRAPPGRTLLYLHGGGFVLGGLDSHDELARGLAISSSTTTVAVDYRLAPECPYPSALHDVWNAFVGVRAARRGSTVVVAGDSAGGNLAAALCQMARDRGGPVPAGQVLLYPMLDDRCATASYHENAEGFYVTSTHLRWFWAQYGTGVYAAPGRVSELAGLPPAIVFTAGLDPLRDEGRAYASALEAAGVSVRSLHSPGGFHGILAFHVDLGIARAAMQEIGLMIQREWGTG